MSTLTASNISKGSTTVPTEYLLNGSAKAWCKFDGSTPHIDDSFGVSSLTDRGTGIYTVNVSSTMVGNLHNIAALSGAWHAIIDNAGDTTSSYGIRTGTASHVSVDASDAATSLFGDLA